MVAQMKKLRIDGMVYKLAGAAQAHLKQQQKLRGDVISADASKFMDGGAFSEANLKSIARVRSEFDSLRVGAFGGHSLRPDFFDAVLKVPTARGGDPLAARSRPAPHNIVRDRLGRGGRGERDHRGEIKAHTPRRRAGRAALPVKARAPH